MGQLIGRAPIPGCEHLVPCTGRKCGFCRIKQAKETDGWSQSGADDSRDRIDPISSPDSNLLPVGCTRVHSQDFYPRSHWSLADVPRELLPWRAGAEVVLSATASR